MKIVIIILIFLFNVYGADTEMAVATDDGKKKVLKSSSNNIWLKTYQNYKNYNIIISNISKIEFKQKEYKSNAKELLRLNKRLAIYKSKLELYEKNNSFNNILVKYKYELPTITLRDYLLENTKSNLNNIISKYIVLKNKFYLATEHIKSPKSGYEKEDIEYFQEYTENVERIHQNLTELKDELNRKYQEYEDEVFTKHLFTVLIVLAAYVSYKVLSSLIFYITRNKENYEEQKNYKKLLSLLFVFTIIIFVVSRYIDDVLYFITFLGVIAAALTIATREIILNIAGSIYIFFSSIVRVGDRVMVQFETKHTIGDVVDISLVKIKLNEVEDYTNLKEVKTVGRTIYIPNSYIFTKVFYNYSLKKNGMINDLIEFEFDSSNNFTVVEDITSKVLNLHNISYTMTFTLNNLKTGILALISYETNYKEASKNRSELSLKLLQAYTEDKSIKLKTSKTLAKVKNDEDE